MALGVAGIQFDLGLALTLAALATPANERDGDARAWQRVSGAPLALVVFLDVMDST